MAEVTLLHNPRCSKSRAALALLRERGVEPEIRRYLDEPLTREELVEVITHLDVDPAALVRHDAHFRELGLERAATTTLDEVADLLSMHPRLMERPVAIAGRRAILGRPPEKVLAVLDEG
jgi:arsenate reductase